MACAAVCETAEQVISCCSFPIAGIWVICRVGDEERIRMNNLANIDSATRTAIRAFIEKISLQYEMDRAILFGSRARMSHRSDSDVDVAVLLRGHSGKFVATKMAMADIAYDVLLETGLRIQPLPIWEEEWAHPESYSNPRLLQNIERDGILL
jgi:predicted nucleotidyltransferase